MNHLNDDTLNAYLDLALEPAARAEADRHLAACPDCAAGLASLRAVFARLESLPETRLTRDLSAGVISAIKPRPAPVARPALTPAIQIAFLVEALLALVVVVVALLLSTEFFETLPIVETILVSFEALVSNLQFSLALPAPEAVIPPSLFTLPPELTNDSVTYAIAACLAAVTLLWFVGNGVLLRPARKAGR